MHALSSTLVVYLLDNLFVVVVAHNTTTHGVGDGEEADVELQLPGGRVPLDGDGEEEGLGGAEAELYQRGQQLVGVLLEQRRLQDDPEGPRRVGQQHQERALHPCPLAAAISMSLRMRMVRGEGAVVVHRAHRGTRVQGDGQDPGQAQRHARRLRHA